MYYSSESSDSEIATDTSSLDYSYLMLDTDSLAVHLRNSIREQNVQQNLLRQSPHRHKAIVPYKQRTANIDSSSGDSDSRPSGSNSGSGVGNVGFDSSNGDRLSDRLGSKNGPSRSAHDGDNSDHGGDYSEIEDVELDSGDDCITQRLFLQHNMLLTLPFEIVKFTHLKSLDLSNNNLTHVNDFLLQLPTLQSLYLQNNNLIDDGLPKEITTLTNLRELNMSGNKFARVPPQLYELPWLKYLYLGSNQITEVLPEIKAMHSLQVLHLGGNQLETVPDEVGELHQLCALILCDNRLRRLPRTISHLTRLRSLLLHKNNLCCLPVGIVKFRGLMELSLRDNPLVTRFVNSCARELMYNPPTLLELAARVIKLKRVTYTSSDLPHTLGNYLSNGQRCVNPKCKGMYFTSCVEHIKFVDFCGMYRVPLMHYLCSSRCSSKTPDYYRAPSSESESEEDEPAARMKRVLLG